MVALCEILTNLYIIDKEHLAFDSVEHKPVMILTAGHRDCHLIKTGLREKSSLVYTRALNHKLRSRLGINLESHLIVFIVGKSDLGRIQFEHTVWIPETTQHTLRDYIAAACPPGNLRVFVKTDYAVLISEEKRIGDRIAHSNLGKVIGKDFCSGSVLTDGCHIIGSHDIACRTRNRSPLCRDPSATVHIDGLQVSDIGNTEGVKESGGRRRAETVAPLDAYIVFLVGIKTGEGV